MKKLLSLFLDLFLFAISTYLVCVSFNQDFDFRTWNVTVRELFFIGYCTFAIVSILFFFVRKK